MLAQPSCLFDERITQGVRCRCLDRGASRPLQEAHQFSDGEPEQILDLLDRARGYRALRMTNPRPPIAERRDRYRCRAIGETTVQPGERHTALRNGRGERKREGVAHDPIASCQNRRLAWRSLNTCQRLPSMLGCRCARRSAASARSFRVMRLDTSRSRATCRFAPTERRSGYPARVPLNPHSFPQSWVPAQRCVGPTRRHSPRTTPPRGPPPLRFTRRIHFCCLLRHTITTREAPWISTR